MKRKFLPGAIVADATLGDRQIRVIANSGQVDRVGDILEARGCLLGPYNKNPVVLANHDSDKLVGTAKMFIVGDRVEAVITFAPRGASSAADECCSLAKAGVLNAVSVGFRPIASEPMRGGGVRFTQWELLELSMVSIPADAGALVIARAMQERSGRVLSGRNATSLAALARCLAKSEAAHCDAVDLLEAADRHRAKAMKHAAQIAASAGGEGEDPDSDPTDDQELAFEMARQKRERDLDLIRLREPPLSDDEIAWERRQRDLDLVRLRLCQ